MAPTRKPAVYYVDDKLGRRHVKTPHTGPMCVINRSSVRHHSSTAETNANDLIGLLRKKKKKGAVIIADGSVDWSVKSMLVLVFMGRHACLAGFEL